MKLLDDLRYRLIFSKRKLRIKTPLRKRSFVIFSISAQSPKYQAFLSLMYNYRAMNERSQFFTDKLDICRVYQ